MDVEQAEVNGATEIVHSGDYSTSDGKRVYKNTGPICGKCHLPFKGNTRYPVALRCKCVPEVAVPGSHSVPIPDRVATSLEMIAYQLGKVVKHLDSMALPTVSVAPVDMQTACVIIPGVTEPFPPVADEAKLAANVAKKDELLKKMGK